jgi:hypothetical protein
MSDPLVAITERLHQDFPTRSLAELMELVGRCLHEIDTGVSDDCMPELVERLARARLANGPLDGELPQPAG